MKLKKLLSVFLALAMLLGVCSVPVFADGNVAKIGAVEYASLAEAVAAAQAGDTVTLLTNVTLSETLEISKSITLDLNENTLSKSLASTSDTTPVIKALAGTVEIKNGTITYDISTYTGTGAQSNANVINVGMNMSNGIYSGGDCDLTLNGVDVSVTFPKGKSLSMICVESGKLNVINSNLSATNVSGNTSAQHLIYTTAHASAKVNPYVSISGSTTLDTNSSAGIHAIWLQGSNDTLIISGNDVTISADATWKTASWSSTYSYAYAVNNQSGAACTIEGGKFLGKVWQTKGTIDVSGGYFGYDQGTSGQKNKITLAEGLEYRENTDPATMGTYPYVVAAPVSYVAMIGETGYETLAEAIAAVPTDGTKTTITMIADETLAVNATLTVAATKNIVLDLNGFTVTGSADTNAFYFITNEGTLEITDTSAGANGKITASTSNPDTGYSKENVTIYNCGGTLTLTAGKIENTTNDGATYAVNNSSNAWGNGDDKDSIFNMNGGIISAPHGDAALRVYQNCSKWANPYSHNTVNITGGTILDTGIFLDSYIYQPDANTTGVQIVTSVNISGGEIHGLIDLKLRHPFNTSLNITGGTFVDSKLWVRKVGSEWSANVAEPTDPMVHIDGGKFSFVPGKAFGLAYDCGASSWDSYETPYDISGGKFNVEPAAAFIASGYEAVANTDDDALTYDYKIGTAVVYVAQIGDAKYETLEAAIEAAQAGDTVVLLQNITLDAGATMGGNSTYGIVITKSITLDGNGKTITSNAPRTIGIMGTDDTVANYIDVTIKDLTVNNANNAGRGIQTWGDLKSLTLNNVVLNLTGTDGYIQPLTIAGGQATKATVTIIGGMISAAENANRGYAISTFNPVDMTITGTTVKGWACLNIKDAQSPGTGSAGSTFTIVDSTLISRNATPGPTNGYSMFSIEDDNVTINVTGTTMTVHGGDNNQALVCFSYHSSNGNPIANHVTVTLGEGNTIALSGDASLEKIGWNNYSPDTWDNKLYIDDGVIFTYAGEAADLMDYVPATFTPAEDTTALNYAALAQPEIYYCWPVNEIDYQGVYCQSFYEPFEGPDSVLMAGERIDLRRDVTLDRNVTFTTVCSFGDSIAMSGGSFILNFGAHDITFGSYKIELPANVTMTTDKQLPLSVFSVASGYAVVETANGDGTYTYSVAPAVAQIGVVGYASLADAIAAVPTDNTETTIVMLANEELASGVTVAAGKNIVLELNGKTISGNSDAAATYAVITNRGTLTIQDSTDVNANGQGTGKITALVTTPDQGEIPGYASNVITNNGVLTINSGLIENKTVSGYAAYTVDNQTNGNGYTPVFTMNGGRLYNKYTDAVRLFLNSDTKLNKVVINGGILDSDKASGRVIVFQNSNAKNNKGELDITGGTINGSISAWSGADSTYQFTDAQYSQIAINISGGNIYELDFSEYMTNVTLRAAALQVTGGKYKENPSAYVSTGYEAVAIDEDPYFFQVGKVIAGTNLTPAETPAEGYDATYTVTKQVVDEGNENEVLFTGSTRDVNVKVEATKTANTPATAEIASAENTAQQITKNLKMDKVLDSVVDSVADTADNINVRIQVVRDKPEEIVNNTITYEVHPIALVYVGEATVPTQTVTISNDALADNAVFTVTLPVPNELAELVLAGNGCVKVTHTSADYGVSVMSYPLKGDAGNYYYVQFNVSHFSEFELAVDEDELVDAYAHSGKSLVLEDKIGIIYHVGDLKDRHGNVEADPSRFTVKYTFQGVTKTVALTSAVYNRIEMVWVAAKEMTDVVSIELYYDGALLRADSYSVQQYCHNKIAEEPNTKLDTLCRAILDYGAAAQVRFEHNLSDLANATYSLPEQDRAIEIPNEFGSVKSGDSGIVNQIGASLSLVANTEINFYFQVAPGFNTKNYTATVNGADATVEGNGTIGRIVVPGIAAKNLNGKATLVLTETTTHYSYTYQYAPMTWAYNKQTNATEHDVCLALYNYYLAAASYFAN